MPSLFGENRAAFCEACSWRRVTVVVDYPSARALELAGYAHMNAEHDDGLAHGVRVGSPA